MNPLSQRQEGVEIASNFDQLVSRAIAYLDPDNDNSAERLTYWEDAESLITLIVLLGGAFVSYSMIVLHLLRVV